MSYLLDMSNEESESKFDTPLLAKPGWYVFEIINGELMFSKKGNEMIVWSLYNPTLDLTMKSYCVDIKGKRFMLKQMCEAVGVTKDENGNYMFESEENWKSELIFFACGKSVQVKLGIEDRVSQRGTKYQTNKVAGFKAIGVLG